MLIHQLIHCGEVLLLLLEMIQDEHVHVVAVVLNQILVLLLLLVQFVVLVLFL